MPFRTHASFFGRSARALALRLGVVVGLLALALVVVLVGRNRPVQAADTDAPSTASMQEVDLYQKGLPAPVLKTTTLNGHPLDLANYRGKVVVLNFWATWCGPCRMEIPEFEELQRQYPDKLQIIGMSVDEIAPTAVATAATRLKINYPVAMAPLALQRAWGGMPSIPTTFLIGPDGAIYQKHVGAGPYELFNGEIRALLKLPIEGHVVRVDEAALRQRQLSPNGKIGTIDIPGIAAALKKLTPAQRQIALAKLNEQACTCGCGQSLASCRVTDPSCGVSLPDALALIRSLAAGRAD